MRAAPAICMANVSQSPASASANPTTGGPTVSFGVPAAPTGIATPPQARAAATLAGGPPRVADHASATRQQRAVSRLMASVCVSRAGGVAAAASAAPVTARPACRTPAAAPAGRAGGVPSAGSDASACAATAAPPRASAPAHPASEARAVSCSVPPAAMACSVVTGKREWVPGEGAWAKEWGEGEAG